MKRLLLFLVACLLTLAADPTVAGGPYVINVTSKTATIAWLVSDNEVIVHPPGGAAVLKSPAFHVGKTTLTGLTPNTRYEYDVPDAPDQKASFKTAPAGSVPFHFVAYGDNRTRPAVHQQVVDAIVAHGVPDFVVQTGDLVADGDDSLLWTTFFSIEKNLLRQTAIFPALGNHEHNSRRFYELFDHEKGYYSFDWGNAHFAVINSDIANVSKIASVRTAYWEEETHWLEEDLKAHQTADYRFVTAHHPPYTGLPAGRATIPT